MGNSSDVLEELLSRSEEDLNEESVCTRILVPYLEHLGWNPTDIYAEWTVSTGSTKSVDYALGSKSNPEILVEAKALHKDPENHIDQLSDYMKLSDTELGLLTNGIKYILLEYGSNNNIQITSRYHLTENPPDKITETSISELSEEKEVPFLHRLQRDVPEEVSGSCMRGFLTQYQSSFGNLDPIHINLTVDISIIPKIREFLLEQYPTSMYIKKEGDSKTVVSSEVDPSIIIIDTVDSTKSIRSTDIENMLSSVELDTLSHFPKNKPLLLLNSPKLNFWENYEITEEQIPLDTSIVNYIHLFYPIKGKANDNSKLTGSTCRKVSSSEELVINTSPENIELRYLREKVNDFRSSLFDSGPNSELLASEAQVKSIYTVIESICNTSSIETERSIEVVQDLILSPIDYVEPSPDTGEFDAERATSGSGTSASQRQVMDSIVDLLEDMADEYDYNGYVPKEDLVPAVVSETGRESNYIKQRLDGIEARDGGDMFMIKNDPKRYKSI